MLVLSQPLLQRRRQRVTVVQGRQQLTSAGVQALRQVLRRRRQRRQLCGPPKRWRRGEAKMAE
jgi:hypothetical protein